MTWRPPRCATPGYPVAPRRAATRVRSRSAAAWTAGGRPTTAARPRPGSRVAAALDAASPAGARARRDRPRRARPAACASGIPHLLVRLVEGTRSGRAVRRPRAHGVPAVHRRPHAPIDDPRGGPVLASRQRHRAGRTASTGWPSRSTPRSPRSPSPGRCATSQPRRGRPTVDLVATVSLSATLATVDPDRVAAAPRLRVRAGCPTRSPSRTMEA